MEWLSYSDVMGDADSYLSITLDLSEPVEIHDFAAFFAGMGAQFDDYLVKNHPELKGTARLYVREVRRGSIIADLVPMITDTIGYMDGFLIVSGFAALFSRRVRAWIGGTFVPGASKRDIVHMGETIQAIAHDKDGRMLVERINYEQGILTTKLEVSFNTSEARTAVRTIEAQKKSLDTSQNVDRQRVLMRFTRPDIGDAEVGKRSGEKVVIEEISDRPLSLMYGSGLAEDRIKDEIRDAESIFYKGFVVDVNVQISSGRHVAYSVTNVHQVIELPRSDDT